MGRRLDYSGDMSPEAQAWAKVTGIAYGWFQCSLPNCDAFRIGCELCGLVIQEHILHLLKENFPGGPELYLSLRTQNIAQRFEEAASQAGCPHWAKYHQYHADPVAKRCADALAKLVKEEKGP